MSSLKARQIKAARALLDWSQGDLANASGLSIATVRKLEMGHISPRTGTARLIRQAFEDNGLEFLESNGVRQRPEGIKVYQGIEEVRDFYDDVYQTISKKGGEIVMTTTDPSLLWNMMGSYADLHCERMHALKDTISVKCLVTAEKYNLPAPSYCEYRFISKSYVNSAPFYIYGDNYALRIVKSDPSPKIVVIQSRPVAETFRDQFQSMWEKAVPISVPEEKKPNNKRKN